MSINALSFFYSSYIAWIHSSSLVILKVFAVNLLLLGAIIIIIAKKHSFEEITENVTFSIKSKLIMMFSILGAIPTILISIFSIILFYYAIEGWFDKEISGAIDQSVKIANLYIDENKRELKKSAIEIASDLNNLYFELAQNPVLLNKVLTAQADMRGITEALIYDRHKNTILAQTDLSFAITFWSLPKYLYDKASSGEIVEIEGDAGKISMMLKTQLDGDKYLIISKLIDEELINYVNQTSGAASKYKEMMAGKNLLKLNFALTFGLVISSLLACMTILSAILANRITKPIRQLVKATRLVQAGDLSVQIEDEEDKRDELAILTHAFNRMIKKIDIQQKDLVLAQRARAWSDVARRVAHEIKNPLTPISLAADRILKKFLPELNNSTEFKKYVAIIKQHTHDIKKIVTEFAEFAKLPAPQFVSIDIVSLLRDFVESRQIINDKITFKFESKIDSLNFVCDVTQMYQLFVNLFKNSEESLENSQQLEKIVSIFINVTKDDLEIFVRDNGVGFPKDLIHKLFDEYVTTTNKGTGLGLAIAKKITEDHGGDIILSNLKPLGAEVKIIFDLENIESAIKK
ncbi:MAG: ATP-binding protein [Rickettsiaceae bacterium]|nr:ATP-binding protein [Rickettsiaceae bacterium]